MAGRSGKTNRCRARETLMETLREQLVRKATEMENAIDNATDINAIAALFIENGGLLYDWPELGE